MSTPPEICQPKLRRFHEATFCFGSVLWSSLQTSSPCILRKGTRFSYGLKGLVGIDDLCIENARMYR
jgi:hypothetical protein